MGLTFKLDEGKVYGARYYTAEPEVDWGEFVPWYEMEDWVEAMYGASKGSIWFDRNAAPEPGERWYANNSKFWFRNKQDLEWFLLRWQ